jgi:hypothetical protein
LLRPREIRSNKNSAQFVIAVFDDWDALHAVLAGIEDNAPTHSGAVLHAREDLPPHVAALGLLKEMTELHFPRSRRHMTCTAGRLAQELSDRLGKGARDLAEALRGWVGSDQAGQLASHIEKGHLVLCIELTTSEDFSTVCGRLVQASPHLVEICNINFGP